MKKIKLRVSIAVLVIISVASKALAGDLLQEGSYYILPKIGVAPVLFTNRGYERRVVPLGSALQPAIVCTDIDGLGSRPVVQANLANTIVQQNKFRIPKFGESFSNRVFDVGFEIGRNMSCSSQLYLEFAYNHAKGSVIVAPTENVAAPDGCAGSCASPQSSRVLTVSDPTYQYGSYVSFGGYLGNRFYLNKRYACNRLAFWGGFKVGILHRKQVTACISIPDRNVTVNGVVYKFAAATLPIRTIFCSSNAVSGGVSLGASCRVFKCASALLGLDIVASCPLDANGNAQHVLVDDPTGIPPIPSGFFAQPTNTFPGRTGVLLQFPVWVGLQWTFDFC
jgi:hypothetical protein